MLLTRGPVSDMQNDGKRAATLGVPPYRHDDLGMPQDQGHSYGQTEGPEVSPFFSLYMTDDHNLVGTEFSRINSCTPQTPSLLSYLDICCRRLVNSQWKACVRHLCTNPVHKIPSTPCKLL